MVDIAAIEQGPLVRLWGGPDCLLASFGLAHFITLASLAFAQDLLCQWPNAGCQFLTMLSEIVGCH
jgi:hypothetical protein